MKNIIIFLLLSFVFNSKVFSQEPPKNEVIKRNNYFYVGPPDLFFNTLQLGYDRNLKNHNSLAFISSFKFLKKNDIIEKIGGSLEFQYKVNLFYDKETASPLIKNHSIYSYFAPFIQYRYEKATDVLSTDNSISNKQDTYINSLFTGFGFGVRLTAFQNRFCLNTFVGSGLKYSDVKGNQKYTQFPEAGYTGIYPKFMLQIGIAF